MSSIHHGRSWKQQSASADGFSSAYDDENLEFGNIDLNKSKTGVGKWQEKNQKYNAVDVLFNISFMLYINSIFIIYVIYGIDIILYR